MRSAPTSRAPRSAVVAGGGIGGMAAALALAARGWTVRVVERAAAITEVGAGLQMSPNASRCLKTLGVLPAVEAVAFRPRQARMRDGLTGREIFAAPLGETAVDRWGAPYLHVHRADLLAALTRGAEERGVTTTLCRAVADWTDGTRGGVEVRLSDGEAVGADLLVAADGVRSHLAERMHGPVPVRFTGQVAWRATLPARALPAGLVAPDATVWAGPGRHVVTYWLRGGEIANLVAVEETPDWAEEGWSHPGDPRRLRALFAGWHEDVEDLVARADEPLRWGLFDRPPLPSWSKGPVALLGDACHPMLPFMAQGAAMAIEDALVLANALEMRPVSEALAVYEAIRRPRATRVQQTSRANASLFHAAGASRMLRHGAVAAVSRLAPGLAAGRLDWLYGHDATVEGR